MRHNVRLFLLVGMLGASLGAFQNCGSPKHQNASMAAQKADFFNYPYTEKPEFYTEIMILKPATSVANLEQFKLFAAIAYAADPSLSLAYTVRIRDAQNRTICPVQTGTLARGQSNIQFDCVSTVLAEEARVEINVRAGTLDKTFTKLFSR